MIFIYSHIHSHGRVVLKSHYYSSTYSPFICISSRIKLNNKEINNLKKMDILTNNIKVKYQTHDRIYLVIEED